MARRVLIVDSDIGFILRLKKALEELDYDVRAMGRARPALSALDEQRYDVAVVDLRLEHGDAAELILGMRVRQSNLPVVVSGSSPSDPDRVPTLDVQGYLHKPYVARDLAQVIERAVEQGYDFYSNLRPLANQPAYRGGNAEQIETVAEVALSQAFEAEPPIDEGATVGRVLELLQDPAVVAEILGGHEANESQEILPTPPESTSSGSESGTGFMAAAALRITEDDATPLDTVLMRIDQLAHQTGQPQIRPLPSWLRPRTADEKAYLAGLLRSLHPAPTSVEELLEKTGERPQPSEPFAPPEYDTTPYLAVTQPILLPEFDLIPDPLTREEIEWLEGPTQDSGPINVELLEALAEAENDQDPRLNAVLSSVSKGATSPDTMETFVDDEAELVPMTLREVTQAMVLPDETPEATAMPDTELLPVDEAAVDEMLGEMDVIARAALQLTQLSLENSALGILLTHHDYPVGRTGNFSSDIWHEIVQAVLVAWRREGENNTRMRYIHLEGYGQCLLFSVRSVDDLTLTLVFSGDLPVRMIRRQVTQLTEALMLVPEKPAHVEVQVPPMPDDRVAQVTVIEDEAPASITQHSRPTDLKAPAGLREVAVTSVAREPGSYAGYACLWLLQAPHIRLVDYHEPLGYWLQKIASDQDWDFVDVMVGEFWVNVHIEIPVKAQPAEMMEILMRETNRYLLEAVGQDPDIYGSVWASSYSLTTPGRLLEPHAVERFIRYYSDQDLA